MDKINISAAPGQPSTFWTKDGVTWYRTKTDAEKGDTSKAVNPQDYEIKKSFFAQHKVLCIILLVAALAAVGYYGYKHHWFDKFIKH